MITNYLTEIKYMTFVFQVGDVDGDFIRCRWAKGDIECLDVCNGLIGAVLDEVRKELRVK